MAETPSKDFVYQIVTERIIKKLQAGVIPWRKPWHNRPAVAWETQKPYSGINALLLDGGEYATFNAIKAAGGHVKQGEKASIIVFWKLYDGFRADKDGKIDKAVENNQITKIPFLRYYSVFEINTQVEGLESKFKAPDGSLIRNNPIESAETLVNDYFSRPGNPTLAHAANDAFYSHAEDIISLPILNDFPTPERYYAALFHEMAHSTGHTMRLHRRQEGEKRTFGSVTYAEEELIAEIASAMLCTVAGIDQAMFEESASYIDNWLSVFQKDVKIVVSAASKAQKACDYILGISKKEEAA